MTDPVIDGKYAPRVDPKVAAAARASAHETLVTGLLRSARSMTSPNVRLPTRAITSGGITTRRASCTAAIPCDGGVHGRAGDGGAAATPLTSGVPTVQPAREMIDTRATIGHNRDAEVIASGTCERRPTLHQPSGCTALAVQLFTNTKKTSIIVRRTNGAAARLACGDGAKICVLRTR